MTNPETGSKWRARIKRRKARAAALHAHGEEIRQLHANSANAFVAPEAAKAGQARVPERLRIDRPEPEVLTEVGASVRAWYRQQTRDGKAKQRHDRRAARRKQIALQAETPQPSARQRLLARREDEANR